VKPSAHVAAAIDIGSNSVHVLCARSVRAVRIGTPVELVTLVDTSDLVGLGDQVEATGAIPPEPMQAVIDALNRQIGLALEQGASRVVLMGTHPLRRATNADELIAAVERLTELTIHVLSERDEAKLTFLGVTSGTTPADALAVVDIGGGSTEVAIHVPGCELEVVPLPLGSGRLTNAIVRHDPPTMDEMSELLATAREIVDAAIWPEHAGKGIRRAIFVGGTATNVARLGQLDRAHLNNDMSTLAQMTADEVSAHFAVRPRRARQLAAGVAIVSALLDKFLLGQADVTQASLRDGAIIAALARGDDWLRGLDDLIG
jgi:exopolyphosphatase/guanosine-5'-triphosphate,3'-diphosphate pyrophosphatase